MRIIWSVAAIAAAAAAIGAAPALGAVPGGNLLSNPEAEAPPTLEGDRVYTAPQGWTVTAALEGEEPLETGIQGPYDSCYGGGADGERELLERSVGEAIGGGARFFYGGETELTTLQQDIAVAPEADGRTLLIGGDFGGFEGQEDHAFLEARFLDGGGTAVGSPLATPWVTAAERAEATSLLPRQASGTVPAGTATIRFVLSQVREEGTDNDGYADNLYATFDGAAPSRPTARGDAACPLATTPVTTPPVARPPVPAPTPTPVPAPVVKITKGPAREGAQSAAVFDFTGTAGGRYECSLDGGPWKPCSSGRDFGPARPGDHLFQVREKLGGAVSAIASYRWTVDLPKACVLRVARARVFAYARHDKARLVIHYTTYRPAKVTVTYALKGRKGGLKLGSAAAEFQKAGVFRLPVGLSKAETGKVRAAKSFRVRFQIARTPKSCGRYYTKRLTIPRKISGQTVWFQSDSGFTAAGGGR